MSFAGGSKFNVKSFLPADARTRCIPRNLNDPRWGPQASDSVIRNQLHKILMRQISETLPGNLKLCCVVVFHLVLLNYGTSEWTRVELNQNEQHETFINFPSQRFHGYLNIHPIHTMFYVIMFSFCELLKTQNFFFYSASPTAFARICVLTKIKTRKKGCRVVLNLLIPLISFSAWFSHFKFGLNSSQHSQQSFEANILQLLQIVCKHRNDQN